MENLKSVCNFKTNRSRLSLIILGGMEVLGEALETLSDIIRRQPDSTRQGKVYE